MKILFRIILWVHFSLLLSACAPQEPKESVEIRCADFYENPHITNNIEVTVGEEFRVKLCSNASTGFRWIEVADISDPGVLEQVSHTDIFPSEIGDPPPPGTPGSQIWTFKALKGGASTLSFEYSRNWEGAEKAAWSFVLTIDVQ
jgi:inhibitor of cysteine peptidase